MGVTVLVFASVRAMAGWSAFAGCIIVIAVASGGVCGGMPLAFTIAQCHSWSGKRAKFKGVRKSVVDDGAADPFMRRSTVVSGCFWNDSCTGGDALPTIDGATAAGPR